MNIIIPIGGIGKRFSDEGYTFPKPLIKILGKPMIFWLLDQLSLTGDDCLHIIYHYSMKEFRFESLLQFHYPQLKFKFHVLTKYTKGAVETLLIALKTFNQEELQKYTVSFDCDSFYEIDILEKLRQAEDSTIVYFEDYDPNPIYSYIELHEHDKDKLLVMDIAEKQKISNFANSGTYAFKTAELLKKYAEIVLEKNMTTRGEYYTSNVYRCMLETGEIITGTKVQKGDFVCVGTPLQVKLFCSNRPIQQIEKKRICFDLDNTLVTLPQIPGDYRSVKPIASNIRFLRFLKNLGHIIIIYTARRMRTCQGNVGDVLAQIGKITFDTLSEMNIPYDEIYFGKPYAHFYIDDLGVNSFENIERGLGYYNTSVKERDFNTLHEKKIETIVKSSNAGDILDGEIWWYTHIPASVQYLFPKLLNYTSHNYEIEKINGLTLSYLYSHQYLKPEQFQKLLESLEKIHLCQPEISLPTGFDLANNYEHKLKTRYENYNYQSFDQSSQVYDYLVKFFETYTCPKEQIKVIHGDPVFSNSILNADGQIKFIDMKGKMGTISTIYGDIFYDWAKVYQSIVGYDFILNDEVIPETYVKEFLQLYDEWLVDKYGQDGLEKIKIITASLLFSLLPLHDNDKCQAYYSLIWNLISLD